MTNLTTEAPSAARGRVEYGEAPKVFGQTWFGCQLTIQRRRPPSARLNRPTQQSKAPKGGSTAPKCAFARRSERINRPRTPLEDRGAVQPPRLNRPNRLESGRSALPADALRSKRGSTARIACVTLGRGGSSAPKHRSRIEPADEPPGLGRRPLASSRANERRRPSTTLNWLA